MSRSTHARVQGAGGVRRRNNTGEGDELKSIKNREGGDNGNRTGLTREMLDRFGGKNQAGEERKKTGGRKS